MQDPKLAEDGSTSYKSDQQFADHIKDESQAVSTFAKNKTLKQQREFLPIYASRQKVGCIALHLITPDMFDTWVCLFGGVCHFVAVVCDS